MLRKLVLLMWLAALLVLLVAPAAHADSFTFATIPSNGALTGALGTTVGWGYTITNQSTNLWLVLSAISVNDVTVGLPNVGIFDFPILVPGATTTVSYSQSLAQGLFEVAIDPQAVVGTIDFGQVVVDADWYDGDPFTTGGLVMSAGSQGAPFTLAVTQPSVVIPEPATILLFCGGFAAIGLRKLRGS